MHTRAQPAIRWYERMSSKHTTVYTIMPDLHHDGINEVGSNESGATGNQHPLLILGKQRGNGRVHFAGRAANNTRECLRRNCSGGARTRRGDRSSNFLFDVSNSFHQYRRSFCGEGVGNNCTHNCTSSTCQQRPRGGITPAQRQRS